MIGEPERKHIEARDVPPGLIRGAERPQGPQVPDHSQHQESPRLQESRRKFGITEDCAGLRTPFRESASDTPARTPRHLSCGKARPVPSTAGIEWELARTWPGGRARERQLKKQLGAFPDVPVMRDQAARDREGARGMTKISITIDFDPDKLGSYTDTHLAMLWHLVQANPADGFEHSQPGDLAAKVGWEIIRRWLKAAPIEMYHHQQSHYSQHQLGKFAIYKPGGPAWDHEARDWNPAFYDGAWAPRMLPRARELQAALADRLGELGAFAGTMSRQEIARELTSILMPQQPADDEDQDGTTTEGYHGEAHDIAAAKLAGREAVNNAEDTAATATAGPVVETNAETGAGQ